MINKLVRKNILDLVAYSSARSEYKGIADVFLDANESPYGSYNRYPDPLQHKLKETIGIIKGIAPDCIFLGNGSDEIIDIAFRIFCEPYLDKAITFAPTYGMYSVAAKVNAVDIITIPLNEDFQMDRNTVVPFLNREDVKLLFLCNPNNPTGNLFRYEDILFLLENFKGMVVIDEAYIDFSNAESFVNRIHQYPNLIVCQTLSKAWAMAGLRVGLAFMQQEILHYYNKVKAPYNISQTTQCIAIQTLQDLRGYKNTIAEIKAERELLIQAITSLKCVRRVYSSDANFILVAVIDAPFYYQALLAKGIVVRLRHPEIEHCLRITIGTPMENERLIQIFKQLDYE
jgi:histidinol-phosphate aminotransferase